MRQVLMCSIAIPSEVILGHSPPVYSSLLYNSLMVTSPAITKRTVPLRIRPCLAQSSIHQQGLLRKNDNVTDEKRNKKKVVFADDRGRPLTQVRVMSEPSNEPPFWRSEYLTKMIRANEHCNIDIPLSQPQIQSNHWEPLFVQPASDYLAFRHKLEKDSVSLENIIVRENEQILTGTVKVKNLAYDKQVVVRVSTNSWKSYDDIHCSYVEVPGTCGQNTVRNLFDTFCFRIILPSQSNSIEFCIKYITEGAEYWDNNDSNNYHVIKKPEVLVVQDSEFLRSNVKQIRSGNHITFQNIYPEEKTNSTIHTWSEFASWQHVENNRPYW